ncbi:hypothetical protein HS088_TW15G00677 [Tripterygium wilfordii]|uniref:cysteine dioxygenase n=1 Tax=Tripterygium wilfordii TaxID=458696 RepID=A0A7J7CM58_TRIWF|nr:plant cysteine oxidase 2-like [Tripterygium wilfordii]KAF5735177.1 hypothetical protein HS088_TW15G00677 [Tripterygium wilfordii]
MVQQRMNSTAGGVCITGIARRVFKKKERIVGHVHRTGIKKKEPSKIRQKQSVPLSVVHEGRLQELFHSCLDVFKGPGTVPAQYDVTTLCRILDNMTLEDVGLSRQISFFNTQNAVEEPPRVTTTTIYKCDNFSLSLFFLPATATIPLHNHPGMTVFSKLLVGSMHIKSYDWVDSVDESVPTSKLRPVSLKVDSVFTAPCDTSVLYPTTGGNIHSFTAITPCVVLDVLGPPYSKEDGRDCSFYKEYPYDSISNEAKPVEEGEEDMYSCLEEIKAPESSAMYFVEYFGPKVTE